MRKTSKKINISAEQTLELKKGFSLHNRKKVSAAQNLRGRWKLDKDIIQKKNDLYKECLTIIKDTASSQ